MNHGGADPSPAALPFISAAALGAAQKDAAAASDAAMGAAVHRAWPCLGR